MYKLINVHYTCICVIIYVYVHILYENIAYLLTCIIAVQPR